MNHMLINILRATLVSFGILLLCLFFGNIWIITTNVASTIEDWLSKNVLLVLGVVTCLFGLMWIRLLDIWIWIQGIIGTTERMLGAISLFIAALFISMGILSMPMIGPVSAFLLIWIGVITLMVTPQKENEQPVDYYHRSHLVKNLANLILETPPQIRRIGILAEWGEGKTQVMKLLENRLRRSEKVKFRMAWVNPWRSGSGEEAWIEIARGVDRALGFPRLLPHSLFSIPVIGTALELLPKPFSGFTSDLKTLLTSNGSAAEKIAVGLSEFLRRRNQWLLIFIDDMERVSAEELKKIFPVVDRLVELERCYFIIAIDPKRIAKAFKEDSAHGEETKGYLDKVLDFQMTLPPASKGEVLEMLQNGIDQDACPKLYAALPQLRDYLPVNPRLADRFLRDADGKERMFLSRFGHTEENYEGFFLLLIFEISFPEAFNQFKRHLIDFDSIAFLARKGIFGSDHEDDEKYKDFINQIVGNLPPHEATSVRNIVDQITHLSTHLLIFDEGSKSLDLNWALEGYRKLIRFSAADRIKFLKIWRANAGKESISSMLAKVDEYDEPELVIRQTLKIEIEGIGNGFDNAYRLHRANEDTKPLAFEIKTRLNNFIKHAVAISQNKMNDFDRLIFNDELLDAWLQTAQSKLLIGLPDGFATELLDFRMKLTKSLAQLLPPEKYVRWAWRDIYSIIHLAEGNAKEALNDEFLPIRAEILDELTEEFLSLLETTHLTDDVLPPWMKGMSLFDLNDPTKWLLNATAAEQSSLDEKVSNASENTILRQNFAILISKSILEIYSENPSDTLLFRSSARPSIEKNPWLLQKCWKAACSGPLPRTVSDKLVGIRSKAIDVEKSLCERSGLGAEIFEILNNLEDIPYSINTP